MDVIWGFLIGLGAGFLIGKFAAIRRMSKWLAGLSPEDQEYVRPLLHPEKRWEQNAKHDISMSRH